jgi:L-ascorbate metabolism protein UlaG (beta-lactamase superfamily)
MLDPRFPLALAMLIAATSPIPPETKKAEIRYLQNSGWVVKTPGHVLVFDYVETIAGIESMPSDMAPVLDRQEERKVIVFVSHAHADHYSPSIGAWAKSRADVQYVLGWPESGLPNAHVLEARQKRTVAGLDVMTTASTDAGVGFLVTVDGLTLYHAGDHARWTDKSGDAFESEVQWLATQGRQIDVAFLPIATGAACEPRPSIWQGARHTAEVLKPHVVFPMHVRCPDRLDLYERFRVGAGIRLGQTRIVAPSRRDQAFHYPLPKGEPER